MKQTVGRRRGAAPVARPRARRTAPAAQRRTTRKAAVDPLTALLDEMDAKYGSPDAAARRWARRVLGLSS